ncbi:hypothetical protein [Longimicrobium sp.]|jgi:hypothetical protein|uniref:hypothetical protein n=1 Tax=Longimicrobium sp. TaxID=2029185 RepID=UPI002ED98EFE
MLPGHAGGLASPMRLLEMLSDRFGLFEALADSTIKLHRRAASDELSMDPRVAEAVLEFADDLRTARAGSEAWLHAKGLTPRWHQAAREEAA